MYLESAIDQLPGAGRDPHLLAVAHLEADARRLARLRVFDRDLRDVERRLRALQPALRAGLARLAVPRDDVDAGDHHLAVLRHGPGHFAVLALVLAGQDHDAVALLDLLRHGYSTSGARLMIFICFFARSSRTTGPKIRVPIGSWLLLTRTAAFESKRIVEPSGRWMSLAVRTMTALWTSPFLTRPRGAASFTDTTMMSPTPAKRRFEPPSTLMHWTRFAPLLSATSRLDCIWIIDPIPSSLRTSDRHPRESRGLSSERHWCPSPHEIPACAGMTGKTRRRRPFRAWRACRRGPAPSRSSASRSA